MKPITILIADDEVEIADLIELHLVKEGYRCLKAADGQEALDMIRGQAVDLAILDIMMPKLDGYEVVRSIREKYHFPVIFLSAKVTDLDKITGLIQGADDYMTKPFNPLELVARVKSHLRRSMLFNPSMAASDRSVLEVGGLVIHMEQRTVSLYGQALELTPKEFDILVLLASNPKRVFSQDHIFQHVWGQAYFEGGNTVMVHIRTLRKKLGEDQQKNKLIKTVWGVGYTFNG